MQKSLIYLSLQAFKEVYEGRRPGESSSDPTRPETTALRWHLQKGGHVTIGGATFFACTQSQTVKAYRSRGFGDNLRDIFHSMSSDKVNVEWLREYLMAPGMIDTIEAVGGSIVGGVDVIPAGDSTHRTGLLNPERTVSFLNSVVQLASTAWEGNRADGIIEPHGYELHKITLKLTSAINSNKPTDVVERLRTRFVSACVRAAERYPKPKSDEILNEMFGCWPHRWHIENTPSGFLKGWLSLLEFDKNSLTSVVEEISTTLNGEADFSEEMAWQNSHVYRRALVSIPARLSLQDAIDAYFNQSEEQESVVYSADDCGQHTEKCMLKTTTTKRRFLGSPPIDFAIYTSPVEADIAAAVKDAEAVAAQTAATARAAINAAIVPDAGEDVRLAAFIADSIAAATAVAAVNVLPRNPLAPVTLPFTTIDTKGVSTQTVIPYGVSGVVCQRGEGSWRHCLTLLPRDDGQIVVCDDTNVYLLSELTGDDGTPEEQLRQFFLSTEYLPTIYMLRQLDLNPTIQMTDSDPSSIDDDAGSSGFTSVSDFSEHS